VDRFVEDICEANYLTAPGAPKGDPMVGGLLLNPVLEPSLEKVRIARHDLRMAIRSYWVAALCICGVGMLAVALSLPVVPTLLIIGVLFIAVLYNLYRMNTLPCPRCGEHFMRVASRIDFPSLSAPCQNCGFRLPKDE
jgi:predicted RNA-binding Zn-ribbon protein involved in translation (DUF1610 family)